MELKGSVLVLNARWNVPSKSATEKMKIHAPSTRTTVVRFNSISVSPGPTKQVFSLRKRHGHSERDHNGGRSTYLTLLGSSRYHSEESLAPPRRNWSHCSQDARELPLESNTDPSSIRTYTVWSCCHSAANTTTEVRPGMFSEVTG